MKSRDSTAEPSELIKGKIYQFHTPSRGQTQAGLSATIGGPEIGMVGNRALVIYLDRVQAWKKIVVGDLVGWVFGYLHEVLTLPEIECGNKDSWRAL